MSHPVGPPRRRCKRGHDLTKDNGSWQLSGSGTLWLVCRRCNREAAKAWRQKNAHRLRSKGPGQGKTIDWSIPP